MANGSTGHGGVVDQQVAKLPGMQVGEVGVAGVDRSGPSIRTIAVPVWRYIFVEVAWFYLHTFLGLLAIDGLGLAELAGPSNAFTHLYTIGGIALAPTFLSLLNELYQYLGKVRAARLTSL